MVKRIVLAFMVLLIVAISVVIINSGSIIKKYVEENSLELIGRRVFVENIDISLAGRI